MPYRARLSLTAQHAGTSFQFDVSFSNVQERVGLFAAYVPRLMKRVVQVTSGHTILFLEYELEHKQ